MAKATFSNSKYYHASPRKFKVGTIISGIEMEGVFFTTSPVPHYTILDRALRDNYTVYQVEPITKVYSGDWLDLWARQVRIVKRVGNARGIAKQRPSGSSVYDKPNRCRTLYVLTKYSIKDPKWGGLTKNKH